MGMFKSGIIFFLCANALIETCAAAQVNHEQAFRSLASADAATRRAGAAGLAEVGRMSDVPALVKALRDRDDETRTIAEAAIWEIWGRSGDAGIDELYRKGLQLMQFGAAREAIQVFTLIISQKPAFAEGWNKRATLYYSIGEYQKSLHDCDEVLKRNPMHFGALAGYGLIYLQLDQPDRAVDYFKRALKINPNMDGVAQNIEQLEQQGKAKRKTYI
jgi:tetratricopeptide (TPR) repeat protein